MYGIVSEHVEPLKDFPSVGRIERKEVSVGPVVYAGLLARKWFVELIDRHGLWGQRELDAVEASAARTIRDPVVVAIVVRMLRELATGWRWLQHQGYEVTDLHAGNFGLVGQHLVMFDFGNESGVGVREHPPIEIAANPRGDALLHSTIEMRDALAWMSSKGNRPPVDVSQAFQELDLALGAPEEQLDDERRVVAIEVARRLRTVMLSRLRGYFPERMQKALDQFEAADRGLTRNPRMERVGRIFDECFDELCEQFEDFGELGLEHDERAGEDNGAGTERQFGYCADGQPIVIAFAAKAEKLDEAQIRGLMRHEFGHALEYRYGVSELEHRLGKKLPKTIERRADTIAELVWGEPVEYGDRDIQCVGCGGKSPRPGHLAKNAAPADLSAATSLAKLLKKAGSSREDAATRIQERYGLSDAELRGVIRSVWGPEQASRPASGGVNEIVDRIYSSTVEEQRPADVQFALIEKAMDIQLGRHKKYKVPSELRVEVAQRLRKRADEMAKNPR
jgi:hypothetical protein